MITNSSNYSSFTSLDSLIERYSKQYDNISVFTIDDIIFITRPLTRKEYKDIDNNPVLSNIEKQDFICKICILYPSNFDLENCPAGIPEQIYKKIIENSYIEDEKMLALIKMYREEMEYVDNQMCCIISKAFPSYKYEEIENMNMIQFCKLFTRAEWIINNNGTELLDVVEIAENALNKYKNKTDNYEEDNIEIENEEKDVYENKYDLPEDNIEDKPINKMTDEQKQALDEFYERYPQFNKNTDYYYTGKVHQEYKEPPALRPNWGRR